MHIRKNCIGVKGVVHLGKDLIFINKSFTTAFYKVLHLSVQKHKSKCSKLVTLCCMNEYLSSLLDSVTCNVKGTVDRIQISLKPKRIDRVGAATICTSDIILSTQSKYYPSGGDSSG